MQQAFNLELLRVELVWNKGREIPGFDRDLWRWDRFGNVIKRDEYGNNTTYGWHIDHTFPRSRGGPSRLVNEEPLHWEANLAKSDSLI